MVRQRAPVRASALARRIGCAESTFLFSLAHHRSFAVRSVSRASLVYGLFVCVYCHAQRRWRLTCATLPAAPRCASRWCQSAEARTAARSSLPTQPVRISAFYIVFFFFFFFFFLYYFLFSVFLSFTICVLSFFLSLIPLNYFSTISLFVCLFFSISRLKIFSNNSYKRVVSRHVCAWRRFACRSSSCASDSRSAERRC